MERTILKDAAATAYGSRGANGVVGNQYKITQTRRIKKVSRGDLRGSCHLEGL